MQESGEKNIKDHFDEIEKLREEFLRLSGMSEQEKDIYRIVENSCVGADKIEYYKSWIKTLKPQILNYKINKQLNEEMSVKISFSALTDIFSI